MGMGPSPYIAARMYYVAEEFCRGPPLLPNNPLGYDKVRLNLSGSDDYTPTLPRVIKWNRKAASIAGDAVTLIDDLRASGHSVENYWQVSRQLSARMQCMGVQDAPRKRRPTSQTLGPWAGGILSSADEEVITSFTQDK
jgi:hypothetical protein